MSRFVSLLLITALVLTTFVSSALSQQKDSRQSELEKYSAAQKKDQKAQPEDKDDSKQRPLTLDELPGDWTAVKIGESASPKTKIKIKKDETGKRLVLEGHYKDWKQEGEVADGKIVFARKPTAEEMSEKAPKWARDDVYSRGELGWKLELKGERRDKEAHLDGKWFPGELQWRTAKGAHPDLALPGDRQAQYLGPGKPLDVEFKKPMPKFFLYAKCVHGLQSIEELYIGVPTLVEAQFDPENDVDEYPVTLKSGDQELKLVAHKIDKKGIIFRTEFFVPGGGQEKKSGGEQK